MSVYYQQNCRRSYSTCMYIYLGTEHSSSYYKLFMVYPSTTCRFLINLPIACTLNNIPSSMDEYCCNATQSWCVGPFIFSPMISGRLETTTSAHCLTLCSVYFYYIFSRPIFLFSNQIFLSVHILQTAIAMCKYAFNYEFKTKVGKPRKE